MTYTEGFARNQPVSRPVSMLYLVCKTCRPVSGIFTQKIVMFRLAAVLGWWAAWNGAIVQHPTIVLQSYESVEAYGELAWPSSKALAGRVSERRPYGSIPRFGSPFSSPVVIREQCLVTLPLTNDFAPYELDKIALIAAHLNAELIWW